MNLLHEITARYTETWGDSVSGQAAALKKIWLLAYRGSSSPIVRGRLPVDCSVLYAFRDDGSSHAQVCVTPIPKGAVRIKGGEPRRSSQ